MARVLLLLLTPLTLAVSGTTPGFDPSSQLGPIAVLVVPLCGVILLLFKLLLASWDRERQAKDAAINREREIGNTFLPIMQTMSELLGDVPSKIKEVLHSAAETSQQESLLASMKEMQAALARLQGKG